MKKKAQIVDFPFELNATVYFKIKRRAEKLGITVEEYNSAFINSLFLPKGVEPIISNPDKE